MRQIAAQHGGHSKGCRAYVTRFVDSERKKKKQAQREVGEAVADGDGGNGSDSTLWGEPPQATLTFEDVSSTIAGKKGKPDKVILADVTGSAAPGRLLAVRVMGNTLG